VPKRTKNITVGRRHTEQPPVSTNNSKQVWIFDQVDNDGHFRFDPNRNDMKCNDVLDKIIQYSKKKWSEIMNEIHGYHGNSKHHFLNYDALSDKAKERIKSLNLNEEIDSVFSMRLDGETRVIGLRQGQSFVVKWFDPKHEFCPTKKE